MPDTASVPRPVRIFISYAHEDEPFREDLGVHLSVLLRLGLVDIWHDRRLLPGDEFRQHIDGHLEQADVILFLVSPHFTASDFCWQLEMQRALERHREGTARAVPVIVRHSDWRSTRLGGLTALPKDGRPVKAWPDPDEAWLDVVAGLKRIIRELQAAPGPTGIPPSRGGGGAPGSGGAPGAPGGPRSRVGAVAHRAAPPDHLRAQLEALLAMWKEKETDERKLFGFPRPETIAELARLASQLERGN